MYFARSPETQIFNSLARHSLVVFLLCIPPHCPFIFFPLPSYHQHHVPCMPQPSPRKNPHCPSESPCIMRGTITDTRDSSLFLYCVRYIFRPYLHSLAQRTWKAVSVPFQNKERYIFYLLSGVYPLPPVRLHVGQAPPSSLGIQELMTVSQKLVPPPHIAQASFKDASRHHSST